MIKCLSFIWLFFIMTVNCLAIDQRLTVVADKYIAATEKLETIRDTVKIKQRSLDFWAKNLSKEKEKDHSSRSDDMIAFYQGHVTQTKNRIDELNTQFTQLTEAVKKLEPIKKEYDKQVAKEYRRKEFWEATFRISGFLFFLIPFGFMGYWIIRTNRKYKKLLTEGKITQEEYKKTISNCSSCSNCNCSDINPSTGLPMTGIGISDVSGTPRGASSTTSSSMRSF